MRYSHLVLYFSPSRFASFLFDERYKTRSAQFLRMRLRAEKALFDAKMRARDMGKAITDALHDAQPESWKDAANRVPGQSFAKKINENDYEKMLVKFVRWCRDDLGIDFVKADDLVEQKSRAAFKDTFLPTWNEGK